MRASGRPSPSTVASAMASGSLSSFLPASSNHCAKSAKGSLASTKSPDVNAFKGKSSLIWPFWVLSAWAGGALKLLETRNSAAERFPQFPRHKSLALLLVAWGLSGCSMALPKATAPKLWGATEADDVTGSISRTVPTKTNAKIYRALNAEDTRRANAAMRTALDPQGDGSSVKWDNPSSGAKGSFTPIGQAFPLEGKICRAFTAELLANQEEERLEGAACREKSEDWALTEIKTAKKT